MALERRDAPKTSTSTANQAPPKKQTNKSSGGKKKEGGISKVFGIVVGSVIILFVILICIIMWRNRKPETKPEDLMPKSAQNVGGLNNQSNQTSKQSAEPNKPLPSNNEFDQNKTQQASGKGTDTSTQRQFTAEQLGKMSKADRQKVLKDSVDNRQDTQPKAFLSNEQIANSKVKLGFTTENLAERSDYANYTKHTSKTADHAFLLWLDLSYKGKKYYAIVNPNYWNNLDDTGIIPVTVSYFIDSTNSENILSIQPSESN